MRNWVIGGVGLASFLWSAVAYPDDFIVIAGVGAVINMTIVIVVWWGVSKLWQVWHG